MSLVLEYCSFCSHNGDEVCFQCVPWLEYWICADCNCVCFGEECPLCTLDFGDFVPVKSWEYKIKQHFVDTRIRHIAFSSNINTPETKCAICLEHFKYGDALAVMPFCKKVLHDDCVMIWLNKHATCPFCKHKFPATKIEIVNDIIEPQ